MAAMPASRSAAGVSERPVAWRAPLIACALAVMLHAALIAPLHGTSRAATSAPSVASLSVRVLLADARKPLQASAAGAPLTAGETASPTAAAPASSMRRQVLASRPAQAAGRQAGQSGQPGQERARSRAAAPERSVQELAPQAVAYIESGRLDPGPMPLHEIEPAFPPEAGQQEGWVVLRLFIDTGGIVENIMVLRSFPSGLFDASALGAFGRARFEPGKLHGVPVKSQMTVEVRFAPFDRGGSVSGRSY
jgi:TonB family protein